jgi:hypothetical protein
MSPWVFVTAPAVLVGGVLLALTIRSLVRTLRGSIIATVPLVAEQRVNLATPGSYDLYGEGSFGTSSFSGLDFALVAADGREVPMHVVFIRTVVRSFSRVRLQLRTFSIPQAGTFTLRVRGGLRDQTSERLVIGRPVQASVIAHILALVFLGIATIGSLVATVLLIVQPRMQH